MPPRTSLHFFLEATKEKNRLPLKLKSRTKWSTYFPWIRPAESFGNEKETANDTLKRFCLETELSFRKAKVMFFEHAGLMVG